MGKLLVVCCLAMVYEDWRVCLEKTEESLRIICIMMIRHLELLATLTPSEDFKIALLCIVHIASDLARDALWVYGTPIETSNRRSLRLRTRMRRKWGSIES